MKHRSHSQLPAKLADGRQQFERWRSQHKPYTHIPEPLWSLATELAREFGLNRTASMMRLDYYGLKKRLERPGLDDTSPATDGPSFLELLPVQATPAVECTIECQNAAGTQIRIQFKSQDLPDLTGLCGELWSRHQ
ncbi:MAG: hypothetical protein IIC50_01910 [Planctomycetes bacterium]|nr:hypothetical protein [Planctomycetota bacterium]